MIYVVVGEDHMPLPGALLLLHEQLTLEQVHQIKQVTFTVSFCLSEVVADAPDKVPHLFNEFLAGCQLHEGLLLF